MAGSLEVFHGVRQGMRFKQEEIRQWTGLAGGLPVFSDLLSLMALRIQWLAEWQWLTTALA